MKLRKLLSIATASVLSAAFLMVGASCNNNNTSGKDENQTIAVIAKGETHAFWQAVKSGAEAAGKNTATKSLLQVLLRKAKLIFPSNVRNYSLLSTINT